MGTEVKRADVGGYLKLVPYDEVKRRIVGELPRLPLSVEKVPIDFALGRVSAEDVVSPCDIPGFSSSAMDGYAVRSSELRGADASHPVSFTVRGSLSHASSQPASRLTGLDTYYVATGAPLPVGADAVVKVEETRLSGNEVLVSVAIPKWKNVVLRGEDIRTGAAVVRRGQTVNAADIALLVGSGKDNLAVFRSPRVGILSTGDELTRFGSEEKGKRVNNYSNLIAGYLTDAGAVPVPLGVARDDPRQIAAIIENEIGNLDALVTIGGSSVGTRDFTPSALEGVGGCEELFHGVRLVPVKPTGLFIVGEKPVVLLPGHSVAASLSFFLVMYPIINILSGLRFDSRLPLVRARLSKSISNPRPIGALFLVRLATEDGAYSAAPLRWGSNLISSLAGANAYLQVNPRSALNKGSMVTVALLGAREILRIPGSASR